MRAPARRTACLRRRNGSTRRGSESAGYQYSGSNAVDSVAWYSGNSSDTTHVVGTRVPNELGIYDMSGNVWEWCSDWYGSYSVDTVKSLIDPEPGSPRVFRGGAWYNSAE